MAATADDEVTAVGVTLLGPHLGCVGDVLFDQGLGKRVCLHCGTVDAVLAPDALDFEIVEDA